MADTIPRMFSDLDKGNVYCVYVFTIKTNNPNIVWMAEDDPSLEILKTGFRSRKRMITIFFNTQPFVALDLKHHKATITATYYTTSVSAKIFEHIKKTARPDVTLDFFCIMISQCLTKIVRQRTTWMRKIYTWWNIQPTHLTWLHVTFGCFP